MVPRAASASILGVFTSGCPLQPVIFGLCSSDMMMTRFVGFMGGLSLKAKSRESLCFDDLVSQLLRFACSPMATIAPKFLPQQKWPQTVWLVRHGQSAGNVARDAAEAAGLPLIGITTRDVDTPLSDLGREQAR